MLAQSECGSRAQIRAFVENEAFHRLVDDHDNCLNFRGKLSKGMRRG